MKRVLRTTMMALLMAVLVVGMLAPAALAAEDGANVMELNIPIKIDTTGSTPVDGAYALFLVEAIDGAPLPNGETTMLHTTMLNPKEGITSDVIRIEIKDMGVYQYSVKMIDGTYYHEAEDGCIYYVDAYNFAETYEDHYEIYDGTYGDGHKFDDLSYNWPLQDIPVVKKWIDQNSVRPDSITAELLLNDKRPTVKVNGGEKVVGYADLTLNASYGWQRKWTGVDARLSKYSVKEVKVPAGYVAKYSVTEEGVYVITNTGALLQTGQLNWPIPVLVIAGMLMLGAGYLMLRKKEEKNA